MNRRVAALWVAVMVAALGFLAAWRLSVATVKQERWRRSVLARRFDAACDRTLMDFQRIASHMRDTSPMGMRFRPFDVESARGASHLLEALAEQCGAPRLEGVRSVGMVTIIADLASPADVNAAAADLAEWAAGYRAALEEARKADWATRDWERYVSRGR